jgi:toxin ParE1/3/4
VVTRITAATALLRRFPRLGRMVPDYNDESIRELIVGGYRVVYRVSGERVRVVAVSHASRDLRRHLGSEPWDIR